MDPSDTASFEASASRRPEVHALTWLALGSLSTAFPMCDTMLHGDDFPDVAGERELLRSIFLGSFMAAMWSLPSHLTDEEKRSLFETVKRVHGHRFIWTTAVGVFAAVQADDPPGLDESTRSEVFGLHVARLARKEDPLCNAIVAVVNISTRLAVELRTLQLKASEESLPSLSPHVNSQQHAPTASRSEGKTAHQSRPYFASSYLSPPNALVPAPLSSYSFDEEMGLIQRKHLQLRMERSEALAQLDFEMASELCSQMDQMIDDHLALLIREIRGISNNLKKLSQT